MYDYKSRENIRFTTEQYWLILLIQICSQQSGSIKYLWSILGNRFSYRRNMFLSPYHDVIWLRYFIYTQKKKLQKTFKRLENSIISVILIKKKHFILIWIEREKTN